jgi:hypothetical protein
MNKKNPLDCTRKEIPYEKGNGTKNEKYFTVVKRKNREPKALP